MHNEEFVKRIKKMMEDEEPATEGDLPITFHNKDGDMLEVIVAFPKRGEFAIKIDDTLTIYLDEDDHSKLTKYDIKSISKLYEYIKEGKRLPHRMD